MPTIKLENIEIPMSKELEEFFLYKYQNKSTRLVDDFLVYLHTQKEAYEINKALKEVYQGKTNDVGNLLNEL